MSTVWRMQVQSTAFVVVVGNSVRPPFIQTIFNDRIEFRVYRLRKTCWCFWHLGRSVKLLTGNLCTLSVSTMDDVICREPKGSIHLQPRQPLTLRPCLSSKQTFAAHLCHTMLVCVNFWQSMHPEKAYEKQKEPCGRKIFSRFCLNRGSEFIGETYSLARSPNLRVSLDSMLWRIDRGSSRCYPTPVFLVTSNLSLVERQGRQEGLEVQEVSCASCWGLCVFIAGISIFFCFCFACWCLAALKDIHWNWIKGKSDEIIT